MIKLILSEIVEAIGGRVHGDPPMVSVARICTDSRTIVPGDLFFAIVGQTYDGHRFVGQALERGAVAAVIAEPQLAAVLEQLGAARARRLPIGALVLTPDPLAALGRLAAFHRGLCATQVIGVVGSNGKTTTKAMIDHVLSAKLRGRASPKSFNNAIGVPLTLLSSEAGDDYLVVEIGTNARGEIAALGQIAQPDMVVLTSIGEEHLEGLGSLEGVAEEECAILPCIRRGGFAAVNHEQPAVRDRMRGPHYTLTTFGRAADADLRVTSVRYEAPWLHFAINERFGYRLRLVGEHNAINAAGAIAIARRLGYDHSEIAARLETFVGPPMRNEVLHVGGVTLLNDAYNANPASALAALESFERLPCRGRKTVVFGEMRELGIHSAALHRKMAVRLRESRLDRVLLVGPAGELMYDALSERRLFGPAVERCRDLDETLARLLADLREGDAVLLKGSRAVGLERLVEPLRLRLEPSSAA